MMRLACIAGFVAAVDGLQTNDPPRAALHGSRAKTSSVSALDPEMRPHLDKDYFHVSTAGEYVMIGWKGSGTDRCDPEDPGLCDLIVLANLDRMENDSECNDLMIRNVSIQGTILDNLGAGPGSGVTKIEFSTLHDVPNTTDYMGFEVNDEYKSTADFVNQISPCEVVDPTGYFEFPYKHTHRFRTFTHKVTCNFGLGQHQIEVFFGVVWRGNSVDTGLPVYANDISYLSISNVPTSSITTPVPQPIGLLGEDGPSGVSENPCNKTGHLYGQPSQRRHGPKFPKRHHWR